MRNLITITIGVLAFTAWTGLMCATGYLMRRRREACEQRRRIARLIADAKAARDLHAAVSHRPPPRTVEETRQYLEETHPGGKFADIPVRSYSDMRGNTWKWWIGEWRIMSGPDSDESAFEMARNRRHEA